MEDIANQNVVISFVHTQPWVLYFDGSSTNHLSGAGVALVNPSGVRHCYSFQLEWKCTNNQAEYEAIIIGLELLLDLEVTEVEVLGDSLLVINQLKGVYKCNNFTLLPFLARASELLDQFADVVLDYIPRERNFAANELTQLATGICLADGVCERILKVQRRTLPSFMARKERQPIIQYLTDPSAPVDKRVRYFATNYVLRGGELLRRAEDGLYLRCIYGAEAKRCLREVNCGNCGSHQAGLKMQWLIRRYGFYWPTMLKDCRGWALDFIGEIHPNSSLQHKHILLATDFFTKWVKAIPIRTTSSEVITDFIFKYIITRYGILECLVADRGAGFMAEKTQTLLAGYGIKFLHSSPYYAQANGQSEASNRVIMLDANPRSWHTELDHTLWAYRTSKRTPTVAEDAALEFGDLVWKACLPYGERVDGRGKWSAKNEGPFVIDQVMGKGAYYLRDTDGNVHRNPMNGRHLKKYFPSVWEYEDPPAAVQST
ncbi:uncharacterized protein LOC126784081 [Argentina anserina]|uniref:uncharacterized protein LOC126784081 n=1 Tax=Argentina anserina TaxID=57926 RepID=UPI0021764761|nr:uncharacterized protein LOC126784081 [Potentilla anserina]